MSAVPKAMAPVMGLGPPSLDGGLAVESPEAMEHGLKEQLGTALETPWSLSWSGQFLLTIHRIQRPIQSYNPECDPLAQERWAMGTPWPLRKEV